MHVAFGRVRRKTSLAVLVFGYFFYLLKCQCIFIIDPIRNEQRESTSDH